MFGISCDDHIESTFQCQEVFSNILKFILFFSAPMGEAATVEMTGKTLNEALCK